MRIDWERGGGAAVREGLWEEAALQLRPEGGSHGRANAKAQCWDQLGGFKWRQHVNKVSEGWYFGWGQALVQEMPKPPALPSVAA